MTELHFVTKERINKGWSKDKKYCATDEKGIRYFLRVSDIQGVYSVQSWIDGVSAEEIIPALPAAAQYTYGFEAGRI